MNAFISSPGAQSVESLMRPDDNGFDTRASDEPVRAIGRAVPQLLPLRSLLVHAFYNWKAILLAACIPAIVGIAAFFLVPTQFTAESTLIVFVGRDSADASGTKTVNLSVNGIKEVNSELDIILSAEVMQAALNKVGIATLFPRLDEPRMFGLLKPVAYKQRAIVAASMFQDKVRVAVQIDTNIVRVTFTNPDRAVAIAAVRAIVEAYLAHRRDLFTNATSPFLRVQLDIYTGKLKEIDAQIDQVKRDNHILDIRQDVTTAGSVLAGLLQRRDQLHERRQAAKAEADAGMAKLAALPDEVFASRDQTNQTGNDDSRNALLRLQLERDHLAAQYRPDYPPVRELDRKIASARAGIDAASRSSFYNARKIRNPAYETLQARMLSAQVEEAALSEPMQALDQQLLQAQQRNDTLREADNALQSLERDREVIVSNYRQFALHEAAARIDEDANRARNANVRLVQDASAPGGGSNAGSHFLAAGLFAAVMFGVATGVLLTFLRKVYILPSEAERGLGIPALADIKVAADQYDVPIARREIAGLASLLLDGRGASGMRPVFQFISDAEEAGASDLVRSLAKEFAAGHGLRTLIIDLQAPEPPVTDQMSVSREDNVAVRPTDITNVWLIANAAATALVSSRALIEHSRALLEGLRHRYDITLLIGPSENGNYASRRLAKLVDLNVLVVRADHTNASTAEELCASLAASGAKVGGFVFGGRRAFVPQSVLRWI